LNEGLIVVLDVGKTSSKLSLWDRSGALIARQTRRNATVDAGDYPALDAAGIEAWMAGVLQDFAARGRIDAIVPVTHGAALAVVRGGVLAHPPIDYEAAVPEPVRARYASERDAFAVTGSPALPDGLNAGIQLAWLETLGPALLSGDAMILTWPQYWAWRLSGVAATETSSLGCHTDLWRPGQAAPSELAVRRGWAERLAPLRRAGEAIGTLTAEWRERTGLGRDVQVYCGVHDSNAALLAARSFQQMRGGDRTVLSTGTWFVAMRSPAQGATVDLAALPQDRDCLVNVDVAGAPVPSARFMGGREAELLCDPSLCALDHGPNQAAILAAAPAAVGAGAMALPTFAPGVGPFPTGQGRWVSEPSDPAVRWAAACLYLALVADASLALIGTTGRILVEGRFGGAQLFVRALKSLRPRDEVLVCAAEQDVSFGALMLALPDLAPAGALEPQAPLDLDLTAYAGRWRQACG
jgi:sugar (pentulose or hexulose) kinase